MPLSEFTALLLVATAASFTPGPNTMLSTAVAAATCSRARGTFELNCL